jgi:hypothetical protein
MPLSDARYFINCCTDNDVVAQTTSNRNWCRYLRCVSQIQFGKLDDEFKGIQCDSIKPDMEDFKKKGTSLIAVLERCKSNYQQKQWDVGAYIAYDSKLMEKLGVSTSLSLGDGVGPCLLKAFSNRESNLRCTSVSPSP